MSRSIAGITGANLLGLLFARVDKAHDHFPVMAKSITYVMTETIVRA